MDAVARLDDAGEAFGIEVDKVSGALVPVTHDGRRRAKRTQPVHAGPAEDAADRGAAKVQLACDPPAVVAQPTKRQDFFR